MPGFAAKDRFLDYLESHGPALVGLLRRLCRGRSCDVDDLFQETAMRIWRHFSDRPILRNPRAWILTIGYRAFLDHLQHNPFHEPMPDSIDPRGESPIAIAERLDTQHAIDTQVAQLPEAIRQVVILHYQGDLTLRQTAEAMGIAGGTVKSRLNSALQTLRSELT